MHRDIRPSNIYYSAIKKCYIIGGFSNSLFSSSTNNVGINLAGVPYYMPKHLQKLG